MDKQAHAAAIDKILRGKKYRGLDIPRGTIRDLLDQELAKKQKENQAVKAVKAKLHNIIAPYLDTLDYPAFLEKINKADAETTRDLCRQILSAHDSTRERLAYYPEFFDYLFSGLKANGTVLDLACGLNPAYLPLVDLPKGLTYRAYDIHGPRIALLNALFTKTGINAHSIKQDILVAIPLEEVSSAFLFKEAHRIEKREKGGSRRLIAGLRATEIFISLPTHSLNGRFDLRERMGRLVDSAIAGIADLLETQEFPSEMVYRIRKHDG